MLIYSFVAPFETHFATRLSWYERLRFGVLLHAFIPNQCVSYICAFGSTCAYSLVLHSYFRHVVLALLRAIVHCTMYMLRYFFLCNIRLCLRWCPFMCTYAWCLLIRLLPSLMHICVWHMFMLTAMLVRFDMLVPAYSFSV